MKRFVLIVVAFAVLAGSVSLVDSMLPAISGPTPTAAVTPVAGQPRAVLTSRGSDGVQATPTVPPRAPEAVTAIGDSVMLASTADLQAAIANITIDAVVGRQVPAALAVLRERKAAGPLGSVVVIHMGTNGYFTAQQFDEMMQLVAGTRRVVFVNVKCPMAWEAAVNEVLAAAVRRYPQAVLVDWHSASANRPELFWDDGVHLRPAGAKVYAALVAAAVNAP